MVSCEKIRYTIRSGEGYLKPESRGVCGKKKIKKKEPIN